MLDIGILIPNTPPISTAIITGHGIAKLGHLMGGLCARELTHTWSWPRLSSQCPSLPGLHEVALAPPPPHKVGESEGQEISDNVCRFLL